MRIEPPLDDHNRKEEVKLINYDHFARFLSTRPKPCACGILNHAWNRRCACGHEWDVWIDVETVKRLRKYE